jgi:predicted transcriptional regulator
LFGMLVPSTLDVGTSHATTSPQKMPRKRIFKKRPSFQLVIKEYRKVLHLDRDMEDGLAAMFAVILSNQISGPPVWLFVVGPPGSGKTTALLTFAESPKTVFQSTLMPHSLVSGFKPSDPEDDPSLLPKLIGNTLVLKDWTEIMALPATIQDDLFGVLRGAYDGRAEKTFGNGVSRVYDPCHFSILAGVTPAIHAQQRATLGERFLKMTFIRPGTHDPRSHIRAALLGMTEDHAKDMRLRSVAYEFLDIEVNEDKLPKIPAKYKERLVNLAQIIAFLRAGVERAHGGELAVRPQMEVGTRLAKQLHKMLQGLALVFNIKTADERCYKIAERIAFDTAVGWNLDIVAVMMQHYPKPVTVTNLAQEARIGQSNLNRRLENMLELGIIDRERLKVKTKSRSGQPPWGYALSPYVPDLWKGARVQTNVLADKLTKIVGATKLKERRT